MSFACRLPMLLIALITSLLVADASRGQSLEQLEQQAIREAIERVQPAVVQLQIIGGADQVGGVTMASGPSTGVLLSSDGYVVTSRYRFEPMPATVVAMLEDGRQFATEVVATDFSRKLVLLKLVNASDLPVVEPAPSDSYRIGQWAIALGRTYRVDRPNVSVGVLSATHRIQGRALQTDAAVSAANYGGPLVNIEGQVLGIIAPMSPQSERSIAGLDWYDSGIGFAAPLADWMPAFERLKQGEDLQLGYMGVSLAKGLPRETAAELATVTPGGPAAEAGLAAGDVITAVAGKAITTQTELQHAVKPLYAGDSVEITYQRGESSESATLTLTNIAKLQELAEAAQPTESPEAGEKAESKADKADADESDDSSSDEPEESAESEAE
ncbi:S1C family serine protease [Aeoliella mucimassa]|uniref:Serine protease HhoB n=1 Tax=Aeoliella mucimassa TaxID=2527972 RepID=A0A518AMV1_9BACT|nr:trypsin-like peptidase domain-containing protein [Aeoliella mucimassa]QDU56054.1 Putative serine protease HhoB precursor [Aeoliella mucimassa]